MLRVYPPPNFWVLHIDGSAKPNPGPMAMGVVLTAPHGASWQCGQRLPGSGCNNEAELRALQAGLALAQTQGAARLRIYTDSQWLVQQLAPCLPGAPAVRTTQRLQPCLAQVQQALQHFEQLQWRWIPRHCNTQADALARDPAAFQGDVTAPAG